MSVPPTCKEVLDSMDATGETRRGQEGTGGWEVLTTGEIGFLTEIGFKKKCSHLR